MTKEIVINPNCPISASIKIISGKWKTLILYHLFQGTKRFNELEKLMPKVTQRMLIKQLRELESYQIVKRKVYPVVPPKVEYSLTELGQTLKPVIDQLTKWGEDYINELQTIIDK